MNLDNVGQYQKWSLVHTIIHKITYLNPHALSPQGKLKLNYAHISRETLTGSELYLFNDTTYPSDLFSHFKLVMALSQLTCCNVSLNQANIQSTFFIRIPS